MGARQEAAAPEAGEQALAGAVLVGRDEHDERRQVVVHAAEAVVGPRAHARSARQLAAGLEERDRRVVVDGLGVHRAEHADLVRDAADVREEFADFGAALAVTGELETAGLTGEARLRGHHAGDALAAADGIGQVLVELALEFGLRIQQVEVRRAAGLEEADDALGLGGEVGQAGQAVDMRIAGGAGRSAAAEQMGEGAGAEAQSGLLQEFAPRMHVLVLVAGHGGQFLVMVSSSVRMRFATPAAAASSPAGSFGSATDAPTLMSLAASSGRAA